jgi:hypothetical protein
MKKGFGILRRSVGVEETNSKGTEAYVVNPVRSAEERME